MFKARLRKAYLAKMKALSPDERAAMSVRLSERLFVHFDFARFQWVHLFLSIHANGEIDTGPIIETIRRAHRTVGIAVPRVAGENLETIVFDSQTRLCLSAWNVPEPTDDRFIFPEKIDLVIAPLLAFDLRGYRVGYGKGFYDRFLRTCRDDCIKVGVSYFPPVENVADAHDDDVRLNYCLTPYESFKF
jgi:5-formyltetrahydrofolate cyclo-ligase